MLYQSTRDSRSIFPANRALTEETAPDGGLFIPAKLPELNVSQMNNILSAGFSGCMAAILELFFSSCINAWDVETSISRCPVKIGIAGRKTLVAEAWFNPGGFYDYVSTSLNDKLVGSNDARVCSWVRVAIGVAYLFAVYAELLRSDMIAQNEPVDFCIPDGDMSMPTAATYAMQMGLPINRVVICSKRNSAIWDLVNHGQIGTSLLLPEQKIGMERIISCILGSDQAAAYFAACQRHGVYTVPDELLSVLPGKLFGSVVGIERIESIIGNVYRSNGYKLSADGAACYGGVQDYRSKTGQSGIAIIFSPTAPNP